MYCAFVIEKAPRDLGCNRKVTAWTGFNVSGCGRFLALPCKHEINTNFSRLSTFPKEGEGPGGEAMHDSALTELHPAIFLYVPNNTLSLRLLEGVTKGGVTKWSTLATRKLVELFYYRFRIFNVVAVVR